MSYRPRHAARPHRPISRIVGAGAAVTLMAASLAPAAQAAASNSGRAEVATSKDASADLRLTPRQAGRARAFAAAEKADERFFATSRKHASPVALQAGIVAERKAQAARAVAARRAAIAKAAAKREAARQAAEKREQARRLASGSPKQIAAAMVAARGWGGRQMVCLDKLWTKESNWRVSADNPTSSAYGIPQALPGRKMASAGADWRTNPATQIKWGLGYIADRHGTPCGAWGHSQANNWY